jgi:hypothetical protein
MNGRPSSLRIEDSPQPLAELRAVLVNEHLWRQREGLDRD